MPEYYLIPKRAARRFPALARAAQWSEGQFFRTALWLIDRLSTEHAIALASSVFGVVGPHTAKARKARKNAS